ncbi:unnamed protein product, partial [Symbiodinium necroappetens]
AKVSKAPPMPYPDRPIAFLAEQPKKPPVKRAPVQPQQSPPPAKAAIAAAPAPSSAASSSSEPVVAKATAEPSPTPAPEDTEYLRRQAFIRQEQTARSLAGMRLLHDGATYAQALQSRIEREMEEQRRADDAAALAKAKPKGPPAHLVGTETRPPSGGLAAGHHPGAWFRDFAGIVAYAPEFPASVVFGIRSAGGLFDFYPG